MVYDRKSNPLRPRSQTSPTPINTGSMETWWVFVLVVLPDNKEPVAAVVTVRQLRGERLRLWSMSRPLLWTQDLSLVNRQF